MIDSLKKRVAFEQGCALEQISAAYIDEKTVGVDACGTKMVFVLVPDISGYPCEKSLLERGTSFYLEHCQAMLNSVGDSKVQTPD